MRIVIKISKQFDRNFQKLIKKRPSVISLLLNAIALLSHLEFQSESLKIHKLKGDMKDRYAFSLTYDLRVIFRRKKDGIWLLNIGSHDEVY